MRALGINHAIYVPISKTGDAYDAFLSEVAHIAGGYTVTQAEGGWLNGRVVERENIAIVNARAPEFEYAVQARLEKAFVEFGNHLIRAGEKAVMREYGPKVWMQEGRASGEAPVVRHQTPAIH